MKLQDQTKIYQRPLHIDHPELEQLVAQEQYDLDRMWIYIHEREKNK